VRPDNGERPLPDRPRPSLIHAVWWAVMPIACLVLIATAVDEPLFLVPAAALLAFSWAKRDEWRWPRHQRYLTLAILIVVGLAFLMQTVGD
jgi:hypothetical protein